MFAIRNGFAHVIAFTFSVLLTVTVEFKNKVTLRALFVDKRYINALLNF